MENETIDILDNGIKIIQNNNLYKFTSDSIHLSNFARIKNNDIVADFCSGSGIVGIYALSKNPCIKSLTLFEMQESLAKMSEKSVELSSISDKVNVENTRLQDIKDKYNGYFSLILCNPPYGKKENGELTKNLEIACCKNEITLSLSELIESVNKCLKFGGRFVMIHRSDRLVDIITELRNKKIEPKRLKFIKPKLDKNAHLVMLEAVKGGKDGIVVEDSLINYSLN